MGGTSFVNSYVALRKPLIISFGTRSSFVAMPSAIHAMSEDLRFEKETINLTIPLGITICRFGTVMAFSFSAVFFAQLYHLQMSPGIYGIILMGTVLAALASAGAPGAATIGMLSLVFNPLGLPVDAAIALMLAVDPLIDPVLTLVNVHTNCACTALIAKPAVEEDTGSTGSTG
jgi:proton glutamate symport protein